MELNGSGVFRIAHERMMEEVRGGMKKCRLQLEDIDAVVPHQANGRITRKLEELVRKSSLHAQRRPRVADAIADVGNTGASSIPVALAQEEREGNMEPGMFYACPAMGAGPGFEKGKLTQGVVMMRVV